MTLINNLPNELVIYKIVPHLNPEAMKAFSLVSKFFLEQIFDSEAKKSRFDVTLANITFSFIPGSFSKLLRYFQKSKVVGKSPNLFEQIAQASKKTTEAGKNPNEIQALIRFGGKGREIGQLTSALVVFDYESKQLKANGPYGLGAALGRAIVMGDDDMVDAIFLHPNVKNIELDDFGLIYCLSTAIMKNATEVVGKIVSLPCAKNLKHDGYNNSLGHFICKAIQANDVEMVKAFLRLPHAANFPSKGSYGLGEALLKATIIGNVEIVKILFMHPNAAKISLITLDDAIRRASKANNGAIIDAIVGALPDEMLCKLPSIIELQSTKSGQ